VTLRATVAGLTVAISIERITAGPVVALAFLFTPRPVTAGRARVGADKSLPSRLALAVSSLWVAASLILALARGGAVGAVPADGAGLVAEGAHPAALAGAGARLGVAADPVLTLAALLAIEAIVTLRARLLAMVSPPARAARASPRHRVARCVVPASTRLIATKPPSTVRASCRAGWPAKVILTLASVRSNTSAVLAGSGANGRTVSTVVALVASAALKDQPGLRDVDVLSHPADVHLGPGAPEGGRLPAPASCLVLVRLVGCHLSGHCVLFLPGAHVVPDHLGRDVVAGKCESDGCRRGAGDGKDCQELAGKCLAECCHTGRPSIGQGWRSVKC